MSVFVTGQRPVQRPPLSESWRRVVAHLLRAANQIRITRIELARMIRICRIRGRNEFLLRQPY